MGRRGDGEMGRRKDGEMGDMGTGRWETSGRGDGRHRGGDAISLSPCPRVTPSPRLPISPSLSLRFPDAHCRLVGRFRQKFADGLVQNGMDQRWDEFMQWFENKSS